MASEGDAEGLVRLFVAVEIGAELRAALAALQARLRPAASRVAWVPPQNLHVSLAFLGNVPRHMLELIVLALDEAARPGAPFEFQVVGTGCFGSRAAPRVIWAGIADCPPLMALQARVAKGLRGLGLELDARPFAPHLTLGRVRDPRGSERLTALLDADRGTVFGAARVEALTLMRSRLLPSGAEYDTLHRARLGSA